MKLLNKSIIVIIVLLTLMLPGGLALAGPLPQDTATPAPTPTFEPSSTPTLSPPTPTPLGLLQVPGILQTEVAPLIPDTADVLTFENFRFAELALRGPFAANGYFFDLPSTWQMREGAELRLILDTFYSGTTMGAQGLDSEVYGGTLTIQYNYITVATIDLNQEGQRQIIVPIPLETLTRLGNNQSQSIQFILDSGINCDVGFRTTVVIRTASTLYLPHDLIDPPVDLRLLPAPFFINSFNRHSVLLIVPDQPTAGELQAALTVSAGFGRMTFNRLDVALLPVSEVPPDLLASTNLIFVGRADSLPVLQNISFPAPVSGGAFAAEGADFKDGIVQMAISPWNKDKVVLGIGGNDDEAVIKAARAFSTNSLQVGRESNLSLVSSVNPVSPVSTTTDVNQTLDDLGYDSIVVSQVGLNAINYTFEIPQGFILGPDAYFDLYFSHTSLLEYERSNIVVKLNDEPIGSVRLSDQTSSSGEAKILLPASAVRQGSNRLRLEIIMEARNECVNPLLDGLWLRVDSFSSLHLPLLPNLATTSILMDLSKYPAPFAFDPLMSDLAFVLAFDDPVGWNVASKIAFSLGNTNAIQLAGLEVYYADSVPESTRQQKNLIIVGRPSSLSILNELFEVLPAPFEPGTDLALEQNLQVSYRLAPGVDIGYLELLSSPWNAKQNILYVGGSSDLGVKWAGAVLQFGRLRSQLSGNLAFINGEQIVTADTRVVQGVQGSLSTAAPFGLTPGQAGPQSPVAEHQSWVLPAIIVALGGILLVLLVMGGQVLARRRSGK